MKKTIRYNRCPSQRTPPRQVTPAHPKLAAYTPYSCIICHTRAHRGGAVFFWAAPEKTYTHTRTQSTIGRCEKTETRKKKIPDLTEKTDCNKTLTYTSNTHAQHFAYILLLLRYYNRKLYTHGTAAGTRCAENERHTERFANQDRSNFFAYDFAFDGKKQYFFLISLLNLFRPVVEPRIF